MPVRPLAALALATALLTACSTVTPDHYAKIEAGMSRDEVYAILGKPDQVSGGGIGPLTVSSEHWTGRKHSIHITFGGDKVALKSIDTTATP